MARPLNRFQYDLIRYFLAMPHMDAQKIHKGFTKYQYQNNLPLIELHEIFRVELCHTFEVYKSDEHADEDVLLAMLGVR